MTRRNSLLLALLVALAAGTYWLSARRAGSLSTLSADATTFSIADTAAVDKVFLAYKDGQQHTLTRAARSYWRLDNKYDVRPDHIKNLLETLKRMEVQAPVPRAARNSVVRGLATSGVKVEVYQHGELAKTFYVGGTTQDELGTFMILAGSEQPYIVHIPGFNGFLTSRFKADARTWRQVPIFAIPRPLLESVEVARRGKPDSSVMLRATPAGFVIDGHPEADTSRTRFYAALYGRIYGQQFLAPDERKPFDSLLRQPAPYVITVRTRGVARPDRIQLWPLPGNLNSLLGRTDRDSAEVMVVQRYAFDKLLSRPEDFRREATKRLLID